MKMHKVGKIVEMGEVVGVEIVGFPEMEGIGVGELDLLFAWGLGGEGL
jgi:hypothetical protein